jgi:hypothetical protein
MLMVTAEMPVTIAIVIQRQRVATDCALIVVETKVTTGIKALSFGERISFLEAIRAPLQDRIASFHRRDMVFCPEAFFKCSLYHLIKFSLFPAP